MQPSTNAGESNTQAVIPSQDERNLAMIAHFGQLVGAFLAPLIVYLLKKDESKYVAFQALGGIYFSLMIWLAFIALSTLTLGLGAFTFPLFWIGAAVFNVIGGLKSSNGQLYDYPLVGAMARKQIYTK